MGASAIMNLSWVFRCCYSSMVVGFWLEINALTTKHISSMNKNIVLEYIKDTYPLACICENRRCFSQYALSYMCQLYCYVFFKFIKENTLTYSSFMLILILGILKQYCLKTLEKTEGPWRMNSLETMATLGAQDTGRRQTKHYTDNHREK